MASRSKGVGLASLYGNRTPCTSRLHPVAGGASIRMRGMSTHPALTLLVEHDLIRKPATTFRDHALNWWSMTYPKTGDHFSGSCSKMEAVMAKYLLVSFKTCPWVQRAAIVLREKKIDFEFRHIEPDNRPDWFLAISPHKKVPVLRLDDKVSLFESSAMSEFLDETTQPRLHPEDPVERAINRAWTDYVPTFAAEVTAVAYADTEADYNKAKERITVPFERLEAALKK